MIICAKTAEPIEMPFGLWARMEPCVRWGPEVLRDVATATNFGKQFPTTGFMGYNVGCMIASDTLFDSGGGVSGSSYPMKTQPRLSV